MAQGTRKWVRVATAGLGVLVCSGLVGCMNTDKDKEKNRIGAKQPTPSPGLYGTPTIGANGTASRTPAAGSTGIQQTGFSQQRVGTTGQNTLNTPGVPPQNFGGPSNFGTPPATIGTPGLPGIVPNVQPGANGTQPTGAIAPPSWGSTNTSPNPSPGAPLPVNTTASASPLSPSLTDIPLPPGPRGAEGSLPVQPPSSALSEFAPREPQPPVGVGTTAGLPGAR